MKICPAQNLPSDSWPDEDYLSSGNQEEVESDDQEQGGDHLVLHGHPVDSLGDLAHEKDVHQDGGLPCLPANLCKKVKASMFTPKKSPFRQIQLASNMAIYQFIFIILDILFVRKLHFIV